MLKIKNSVIYSATLGDRRILAIGTLTHGQYTSLKTSNKCWLLSAPIDDSIALLRLQMLKHPTEKLVVLAPHLVVVAKGQVNQQLAEVFLNVLAEVCCVVQLQEVLEDHLVHDGALVAELLLKLCLVEG